MSNSFPALNRVFHFVADLLAPQDCFVCGGRAAERVLCDLCRAELPLQPAATCPICALPATAGEVCGHCLRDRPAFDATRAVYRYDFPVDRMVQALKYRHRLALADVLGDALAAQEKPAGADVVLPMPLHPARLRERGFNQAVELARSVARIWGLPLDLASVRRRTDTPAQAGLPRVERRVNLRGAFECDRSFAGLTVVVVDDVMTTGASLDELARVLKRQGAVRVENRVVARTPSVS